MKTLFRLKKLKTSPCGKNCPGEKHTGSVPDGLGVRIPDSHPGGPGSIPGQGAFFENQYFIIK